MIQWNRSTCCNSSQLRLDAGLGMHRATQITRDELHQWPRWLKIAENNLLTDTSRGTDVSFLHQGRLKAMLIHSRNSFHTENPYILSRPTHAHGHDLIVYRESVELRRPLREWSFSHRVDLSRCCITWSPMGGGTRQYISYSSVSPSVSPLVPPPCSWNHWTPFFYHQINSTFIIYSYYTCTFVCF